MSKVFDAYLAFILGDVPNFFDEPPQERKNRKGFSLTEFLIAVLVVLMLVSFCVSAVGNGWIGNGQNVDATEQATTYANYMYPGKNARVQCVRLDSDHDGYVSCTIAYDAENAITGLTFTETVAVECAAGFTFNEGCRMPKARVNTQ